jgi:hypothetical protein
MRIHLTTIRPMKVVGGGGGKKRKIRPMTIHLMTIRPMTQYAPQVMLCVSVMMQRRIANIGNLRRFATGLISHAHVRHRPLHRLKFPLVITSHPQKEIKPWRHAHTSVLMVRC